MVDTWFQPSRVWKNHAIAHPSGHLFPWRRLDAPANKLHEYLAAGTMLEMLTRASRVIHYLLYHQKSCTERINITVTLPSQSVLSWCFVERVDLVGVCEKSRCSQLCNDTFISKILGRGNLHFMSGKWRASTTHNQPGPSRHIESSCWDHQTSVGATTRSPRVESNIDDDARWAREDSDISTWNSPQGFELPSKHWWVARELVHLELCHANFARLRLGETGEARTNRLMF